MVWSYNPLATVYIISAWNGEKWYLNQIIVIQIISLQN